MNFLDKYQAEELLEFSDLIEECGGYRSSMELTQIVSNIVNKNIKTASKNGLSDLAKKELLEINKNALAEMSRYYNDLANDYFVSKASSGKIILSSAAGDRVVYSVPLLNFAKKSFDMGGLAGFLSGIGKGGFIGGLGKGAAMAKFSKLLDEFVQSENFGSIKEIISSAKKFLSTNSKQLLMMLVGVAVYAIRAKNKENKMDINKAPLQLGAAGLAAGAALPMNATGICPTCGQQINPAKNNR